MLKSGVSRTECLLFFENTVEPRTRAHDVVENISVTSAKGLDAQHFVCAENDGDSVLADLDQLAERGG